MCQKRGGLLTTLMRQQVLKLAVRSFLASVASGRAIDWPGGTRTHWRSPTAVVASALNFDGECNDDSNIVLTAIFERCGDQLVASSLRCRGFLKDDRDVLVGDHVSQSIGAQ